MPVPCDCCPTGEPRCALVATRFDGVAETTAAAGWTPVNLAATIDGVTATAVTSGYNSPAGLNPTPTPQVTYTMAAPHNRVRGLRLWNQGGGDLNDADGLGPYTADFYAGAVLLASLNASGANGAAPLTAVLPGGAEVNAVDRVVIRNLGKLAASAIAPLWRELQFLELQTAFPCRRRTGVLEWYDVAGNLVPAADIVGCAAATPLVVSALTMTEAALGDDPGLGERICNVVPPVTSSTGYSVQPGPCYDGSAANGDTLTWAGPLSSVSMSYESGGSAAAGAAIVSFSAPSIGTVTWPANGTKMLPGEVRTSNPLAGGGRATITYLPPAGAPAAGAPSQDGGPNIRLGPAAIQAYTPYHFRIDFFAP